MTTREAKRLACHFASRTLLGMLGAGWPEGDPWLASWLPEDRQQIAAALEELIGELARRAGSL